MPRRALITGASSGIGTAFARLLAAEGHDLVITARRRERLETLAGELREAHGVDVLVLPADLSDPTAPTGLVGDIRQRGLDIDILINNAGFGSGTGFVKSDWQALQGELQLMVMATTQLMHLLIPEMQQRGWGRVVNVASVAAYAPQMRGLLYSGTKSYLLNASISIDMETRSKGVHVSALCPGLTETEFFDVQGSRGLVNKMPKLAMQSAEDVARRGWDAVQAGQPVCVPSLLNKTLVAVSRSLPEAARYRLGKLSKLT